MKAVKGGFEVGRYSHGIQIHNRTTEDVVVVVVLKNNMKTMEIGSGRNESYCPEEENTGEALTYTVGFFFKTEFQPWADAEEVIVI